MPYTISEVIVLFFTYSVVGWLWETVYCSLKDHQYAYRGFLFGPYCPVYGFTITTILITTYRVRDNIILLFIVGMIVASVFRCQPLFGKGVSHETVGLLGFVGKPAGADCTPDLPFLGNWGCYPRPLHPTLHSTGD